MGTSLFAVLHHSPDSASYSTGMDAPATAPAGALQQRKESPSILLGLEHPSPAVAPGHDVVKRTGIFKTQRAGHGRMLSENCATRKNYV